MPNSLSTNLNQVMAETGFLAFDQYVGNADQNAAQIVAIAQAVAMEAVEETWQVIRKTQAITLTSATTYALPSDYLQYIPDTMYQHGRWDAVDLPTTESTWALLTSIVGIASLPIRARIIDNQLNIMNPQAGATVNVEYSSNTPITDSTGVTAKPLFTLDTDLWVLDDRMFQLEAMWRWEQKKGLPNWQVTLQDAASRRAGVRGRDTGNSTIVPGRVALNGVPYTNLWVT